MKLIVTGGGTGGHVFPALEIGRAATLAESEPFTESEFWGSHRGIAQEACNGANFPFRGFDAEPIYSLATLRGLRSLSVAIRASSRAKAEMKQAKPSVIFSTGGYSAAPILLAASRLHIPFVLHDSNSVPGRVQRLFAKRSAALTCVFKETLSIWPTAIQTGQPIRSELREAAKSRVAEDLIFVTGGSGGSRYLNLTVPQVASKFPGMRWRHATGKAQYEEAASHPKPDGYDLQPFLNGPAIAATYQKAKLVIARSGGTLAELALFRIPSVLVPFPQSADNHQLKNALEFGSMGAAVVVEEASSASNIENGIRFFLDSTDNVEQAEKALAEWDRSETAVPSILKILRATSR